jgi:hypothetical protein
MDKMYYIIEETGLSTINIHHLSFIIHHFAFPLGAMRGLENEE